MIFNKPNRVIHSIFLHCSASDNPAHDNVEVIREWHLARRFNDIGYHFYINKKGQLFNGRDCERAPAAQKGYNSGTLAICLGGLETFTKDQFTTLKEFCEQINDKYEGLIRFRGHCEVSSKTCPVFDYKKVLDLDRYGRMK